MPVWQIDVHNPDGSLRRTLTPSDPVDSIAWSVRGDGDCLEASIVASAELGLAPREILCIRAHETADGVGAPPRRYWGWVVESADPRHPDLVETRLVGGAHRLREVVTGAAILPAGDVASLARTAVQSTLLPPRIRGVLTEAPASPPVFTPWALVGDPVPFPGDPFGEFPSLGFRLGERLTRLETLADTLDALAEAVPGFVVQPGSSYSYASTDFAPGDAVPGVSWGVRARDAADDAQVFFRRAVGDGHELDEINDELVVEFEPISSDEVVDRVRVLLADQPAASSGETPRVKAFRTYGGLTSVPTAGDRVAPQPLVFTWIAPDSAFAAERVVPVPPLEVMKRAAWAAASSDSNTTNAAYAYDAVPTSFSRNTSAGSGHWGRRAALTTRGVRVRLSSFVPTRLRVLHDNDADFDGDDYEAFAVELPIPATNGEQVDVALIAPPSRRLADEITRVSVHLFFDNSSAADEVRVYTLEPLEPDLDVLERIARSHVRLPPPAAATVLAPNRILRALPTISVTLADASLLTGVAGAYEYSVTRDEGLSTQVRLGHEYPAETEAARSLLSAKIDRRAAAGVRRRSLP